MQVDGAHEYSMIQVTDAAGRVLKHLKMTAGSSIMSIDVHDIAAGKYVVVMQSKNSRVAQPFLKVD